MYMIYKYDYVIKKPIIVCNGVNCKILQRNISPHLLESNVGKLKDPDCQQGSRAADSAHSLVGM